MFTKAEIAQKHREYMKLAEKAARDAQNARSAEAKQAFEKLAEGWQQLAHHLGHIVAAQKKR
jgi:hypothetical protein